MLNLVPYVTFTILPVAASLLITARIGYIVVNPKRYNDLMIRAAGNTAMQTMYSKVYNVKSLIAWASIALVFSFNFVFDLYRLRHTPSVPVLMGVLLLSLGLMAASSVLFLKKRQSSGRD